MPLQMTREIMNALNAGFVIPELRFYKANREDPRTLPEFIESTGGSEMELEAFTDAMSLKSAVLMVYSADTLREYEADIARYSSIASELNEKYGEVALIDDETTKGQSPLGLVWKQHVAFVKVNQTTYKKGSEPVTVVRDLRKEAEEEDEVNRRLFMEKHGLS